MKAIGWTLGAILIIVGGFYGAGAYLEYKLSTSQDRVVVVKKQGTVACVGTSHIEQIVDIAKKKDLMLMLTTLTNKVAAGDCIHVYEGDRLSWIAGTNPDHHGIMAVKRYQSNDDQLYYIHTHFIERLKK